MLICCLFVGFNGFPMVSIWFSWFSFSDQPTVFSISRAVIQEILKSHDCGFLTASLRFHLVVSLWLRTVDMKQSQAEKKENEKRRKQLPSRAFGQAGSEWASVYKFQTLCVHGTQPDCRSGQTRYSSPRCQQLRMRNTGHVLGRGCGECS